MIFRFGGIRILCVCLQSIPRLQVTTEENEAGGETLIINGGNAQGTKTFINSEFVVDQLKQI